LERLSLSLLRPAEPPLRLLQILLEMMHLPLRRRQMLVPRYP
jgi:hypothetical protein